MKNKTGAECGYCDASDKNINTWTRPEDRDLSVCLSNSALIVSYESTYNDSFEQRIKIKYCPMCGRKLF